jgi:hypothetical protein
MSVRLEKELDRGPSNELTKRSKSCSMVNKNRDCGNGPPRLVFEARKATIFDNFPILLERDPTRPVLLLRCNLVKLVIVYNLSGMDPVNELPSM